MAAGKNNLFRWFYRFTDSIPDELYKKYIQQEKLYKDKSGNYLYANGVQENSPGGCLDDLKGEWSPPYAADPFPPEGFTRVTK